CALYSFPTRRSSDLLLKNAGPTQWRRRGRTVEQTLCRYVFLCECANFLPVASKEHPAPCFERPGKALADKTMRPDMRACGSRYRRVSRATAGFTHDETTRHVPLRQTGMDVASNLLADKTPNKETLVTQLMYEMRAKQQTTLTPRLQQSVKLLQMSTLDFSREVAEAISN